MRLVAAMNTDNPALITLSELGCEVSVLRSDEDETQMGSWCARIKDAEFEADDPVTLLGLVSIWRHRGSEWLREDDPDLYDAILEKTFPK